MPTDAGVVPVGDHDGAIGGDADIAGAGPVVGAGDKMPPCRVRDLLPLGRTPRGVLRGGRHGVEEVTLVGLVPLSGRGLGVRGLLLVFNHVVESV